MKFEALKIQVYWFLFALSRVMGALGEESSFASSPSDVIVFAGHSGAAPRFIDQGQDRGMGWMEFETREIRKGLKEDGFNIKQEWFTPARIAHEFRTGSPICTWPVKWQNPVEKFSSQPDRIYSIPLNLEGDEGHRILFHKEDLERFKKHFDQKGDLDLDSLLRDQTLGTLLVRDFDYGGLTNKVLYTNKDGDQEVRSEFQKSVQLLLIKDNLQILEMLNARRFDYVFADSIEEEDYVRAKINKEKFLSINYKKKRITSLKDPNLIMVSVACAPHPLTMRAMPYINRWIAMVRGTSWLTKAVQYRASIDTKVDRGASYINSTLHNFRGQIYAGEAESWYPLQQKYFPTLELKPKMTELFGLPPLPKRTIKLKWRAFSEAPGAVTIASNGSLSAERYEKNPYTWRAAVFPYPEELIKKYLSPEQAALHLDSGQAFDGPLAVDEFRKLSLSQLGRVKKLTLFAQGLQVSDLEQLRPALQELEELNIFGAGPSESEFLVSLLPKTLKHLNLTLSSLGRAAIEEKIRGMPLQSVHLSATQLTGRQVLALFRNLPPTLEALSLGYLRNSFDNDVLQGCSGLRFPKLRSLDLENDILSDQHLSSLLPIFGSKMEKLRLGHNFFSPLFLAQLLSHFPNLTELDLQDSSLGSALDQVLRIPSGVKHLNLARTRMTGSNLNKIVFPADLKTLDLSDNTISDDALVSLIPKLSDNILVLNLSKTSAGPQVARELANPRFKKIDHLDLSGNSLSDATLRILSEGKSKIIKLNLGSNQIHNAGTAIIAAKWLPDLEALALGSNPISEAAIPNLVRGFSSKLTELDLSGLLSLDVKSLAEALPKDLRILNLSGNQLSDQDLVDLASHIPAGLRTLNLRGSAFSEKGARAIAEVMPPSLVNLSVGQTPIGSRGILHLSRALPETLRSFDLGPVDLSGEAVLALAEGLPQGLTTLHLGNLSSKADELSVLVKRLPRSLRTLFVSGTPLTEATSSAWLWPRDLRFFYWDGHLGDIKFKALVEQIPETIDYFGLYDVGIGDLGLSALSRHPLPHLHFLEVVNHSISKEGWTAFMKQPRSLVLLNLSRGTKVMDGFFDAVSDDAMRRLMLFYISNTALSNSGLSKICQRLRPSMFWLDLSNSLMKFEGIETVVRALPKQLFNLTNRGNEIGQKGLEAFERGRRERALQSGLVWRLHE